MKLINPTNNKIAIAHLSSRVKQAAVAVLSVTFGISMYIFMNSFMNGVNETQTGLAFSTLAHIRIYNDLPEDRTNLLKDYRKDGAAIHIRHAKVIPYTEGIRNSQTYMDLIRREPGVTVVTPQVNINVFFRNGSVRLNGILSGIDVQQENELFGTGEYVIGGSWDELTSRSDGIIMGVGLAKKLSLKLNDNVVVSTADGVTRTYTIIGLLKTTLGSVDNSKAYIRISSARQLLSKNRSYVTDIQVNITDFEQAQKLARKLAKVIPCKVEPWQEANGQLEAANELRNIIAVAVSLTILLVAGFGIYNIMNMTVNEKIREIAILKAMGFGGRDIVEIFLVQSVMIGILGGLIGILLGYIVAISVNNVPFHIATLTTLPMSYLPVDYVLAFLFGLITTFVAGYLPAKKASKIDPVEIIRG